MVAALLPTTSDGKVAHQTGQNNGTEQLHPLTANKDSMLHKPGPAL